MKLILLTSVINTVLTGSGVFHLVFCTRPFSQSRVCSIASRVAPATRTSEDSRSSSEPNKTIQGGGDRSYHPVYLGQAQPGARPNPIPCQHKSMLPESFLRWLRFGSMFLGIVEGHLHGTMKVAVHVQSLQSKVRRHQSLETGIGVEGVTGGGVRRRDDGRAAGTAHLLVAIPGRTRISRY